MKKLKSFIILSFFLPCLAVIGNTLPEGGKSPTDHRSGPRLINITEINAGLGLYDTDRDYAGRLINLTDILGIEITRNFTGGIGIGISLYNGGTLEPLFADLRYFFNLERSRIYIYGDAGMLIGSAKTADGTKFILNPGIGWQRPLTDFLALNLSGGLLTQMTREKSHDSFAVLKAGITISFGGSR